MLELYSDDSDRIKVLFATAKMVRLMPDVPQVWKFNIEYLDILCEYMHIISHEKLMDEKFLDAPIDATSKIPGCVGLKCFYPLIRI